MSQNLIIGAVDNYDWDQIKFWANSIKMSGYDGVKAIVVFNSSEETVKRLVSEGFVVITQSECVDGKYSHPTQKFPIHVERFFHFFNFLNNVDEEFDWIITTDVKDVVFQSNPVEYLENHFRDDFIDGAKLIASPECILYENEPWGAQNLLQTFGGYFYNLYKSKPIYNVGVLAGTHNYMKSLFLNIFQMSLGRPIPITDQSIYNFLLWQEPWKNITSFSEESWGWSTQLGTRMDTSKPEFEKVSLEPHPRYEDGKFVNADGMPFVISHQWDRCDQNIVDEVKQKYS